VAGALQVAQAQEDRGNPMFLYPIPITVKQRPIAGKGLLSTSANGETILYTPPTGISRGAWFVTGGIMGAGTSAFLQVQVDRGYINGLIPVVGSNPVPINGNSQSSPPSIYGQAKYDEEGRAWVGILITIDSATGSLKNSTQANLQASDMTITIQTSPYIASADGSAYFHPIAVIMKDGRLIQISYFDYQWGTFKQRAFWRHMIIPA